MIRSLAFTKSPTQTTDTISKIKILSQIKPSSSKTKQNKLGSLSKTERSSPLSQSALIESKLNKSTLNSPRAFNSPNSKLVLNKTVSTITPSQFKTHKQTTSSVSDLSRPITKITTKTSFAPKSFTNRSMVKSQILSRSKISSPLGKSTVIKSKVTSKPAVPSFGRKLTGQAAKPGSKITNSKTSSKMHVIKQEPNAQILYPIHIEELENKLKVLTSENGQLLLEIDCLKLQIQDKSTQNQLLEDQIIKYEGEKMVQIWNNKILTGVDKQIEIELEALKRLNTINQEKLKKQQETINEKDRTIEEISLKLKDYDNQLIMITQQLKTVEKKTAQLLNQKIQLEQITEQFEQNSSIMHQSILVKDEEVSELKLSLVNVTRTWQNKYKNLQDQLQHSKLQYLKKQKDLETTRMILEEQRGKSFHNNQQLMTMITETDVKNEEQIQRLQNKIEQLEEHLRSYEEILEKMERDIQNEQSRKQDFEAERDSEMDNLQELLSKIKEEGKQFLRVREDEIEKRDYKRMYQNKSSIR